MMSYEETMRGIEAEIPNIEGMLECLEMGGLFIEVPNNWFLKFDITPRGVQIPDRMCWLVSSKQFEELIDTRPGPKA